MRLTSQVLAYLDGRYQILSGLKFLRDFLTSAIDVEYLLKMGRYLFEGMMAPPVLDEPSLLDVDLRSERIWWYRAAWALSVTTDRVVDLQDVIFFRPAGLNPRPVVRTGGSSQRTPLEAKFRNFPVLPEVMRKHPHVAGIAMPFPRVAEYFSNARSPSERARGHKTAL